MQSYCHGTALCWVPVHTMARIVMVSDDAFLRRALQIGIDQGWLLVEGGQSICLTEAGERQATYPPLSANNLQ